MRDHRRPARPGAHRPGADRSGVVPYRPLTGVPAGPPARAEAKPSPRKVRPSPARSAVSRLSRREFRPSRRPESARRWRRSAPGARAGTCPGSAGLFSLWPSSQASPTWLAVGAQPTRRGDHLRMLGDLRLAGEGRAEREERHVRDLPFGTQADQRLVGAVQQVVGVLHAGDRGVLQRLLDLVQADVASGRRRRFCPRRVARPSPRAGRRSRSPGRRCDRAGAGSPRRSGPRPGCAGWPRHRPGAGPAPALGISRPLASRTAPTLLTSTRSSG